MRHLQKAGTAKIWSLRRPEVKRPQDLGALEALDGRRAVGAPDFCGVCLKISERNWLGSAGGIPPTPPFRPSRLEPERKGRFQVFSGRSPLAKS